MTHIIHGELHAPYFVFIRSGQQYPDAEMLNRFHLSGYERNDPPARATRYVLLADLGEWTLIADDWFYTLWHLSGTRDVIAELGSRFELFACSVGDSDDSYDFVYYRGGELLRKHVVIDPRYDGGVIQESFGAPLSGEGPAGTLPKLQDYLPYVLGIARRLGIRPPESDQQLRRYVPGPQSDDRPKPGRPAISNLTENQLRGMDS
jgi:hypothetical protein